MVVERWPGWLIKGFAVDSSPHLHVVVRRGCEEHIDSLDNFHGRHCYVPFIGDPLIFELF
jgi:hypothetical protein